MLHRRLKIADGDNGNDNLWQQRRQQGWRDRRREEEEEVTIMKKMGDDGDESLRCRWLLQLAPKKTIKKEVHRKKRGVNCPDFGQTHTIL